MNPFGFLLPSREGFSTPIISRWLGPPADAADAALASDIKRCVDVFETILGLILTYERCARHGHFTAVPVLVMLSMCFKFVGATFSLFLSLGRG